MTREQAELLLKIIDAKILTHSAKNSWDGGLGESIEEGHLVDSFLNTFEPAAVAVVMVAL